MFQRLFLVILNRVFKENKDLSERFIKFFLDLINLKSQAQLATENLNSSASTLSNNCKFNIRFMSEYFAFLFDFARGGMDQCLMIIKHGTISKCSKFYLANRRPQKLTGHNRKLSESSKQIKGHKIDDDIIFESDSSKSGIKENIIKKSKVNKFFSNLFFYLFIKLFNTKEIDQT